MARFESRQDLINEQKVIEVLLKEGESFQKLKENDLDFLVKKKNGESSYFAEVKCTKRSSESLPRQMLSAAKIIKMKKKKKETGVPVYLIYRYSNCISVIEVDKINGHFELNGRISPREGAANDTEMVVWIPRKCIKEVKEI